MSQGYILYFEFVSFLLFGIEYFFYKKQLNIIERLFVSEARRTKKLAIKSCKNSKEILNKKLFIKIILQAILTVLLIVILIKLYNDKIFFGIGKDISILVIFFLSIFTIIWIPRKVNTYLYNLFFYNFYNIFIKCMYSIRKGAIVGLGLIFILFSFLGKLLNLYNIKYIFIDFTMFVMSFVLSTFLIIILINYLRFIKNK